MKKNNLPNTLLSIVALLLIAMSVFNCTATTVNAQSTYEDEMSVCVFEGEQV